MIPVNITTDLNTLKAQTVQYNPLENAPRAAVTAMQLNAANLVQEVQAALVVPNDPLDTFVPPVDPDAIVSSVLSIVDRVTDQSNLSLLRGVVGRVSINLDQLP
jgi:hypothetical protein